MADVTFDTKQFFKKSKQLLTQVSDQTRLAVNMVAEEILRLSQFEVPHDKGALQISGHVESESDYVAIVGYNKVYAARLHENPQYHFQKGRKGKYLEDPIKTNLDFFKKFLAETIRKAT